MTYDEAYELEPGDRVIVTETGEQHTVEVIDGNPAAVFLILDNGYTYRCDQVSQYPALNVDNKR